MRSRTSRGVPEWSGGKDLYMGSLVLVAGKVSRIIGIVPSQMSSANMARVQAAPEPELNSNSFQKRLQLS